MSVSIATACEDETQHGEEGSPWRSAGGSGTMMKLRTVDKFGVKIAVAEKCGMASGANVMVVVGWAAGDLVRVSEFGCSV